MLTTVLLGDVGDVGAEPLLSPGPPDGVALVEPDGAAVGSVLALGAAVPPVPGLADVPPEVGEAEQVLPGHGAAPWPTAGPWRPEHGSVGG